MNIIATILILFTLFSCGKKEKDHSSDGGVQLQVEEGNYQATLEPVHKNVASDVSGKVTLAKRGDHFNVIVTLSNAPPGPHMQLMHLGLDCPTYREDENQDDVIDAIEARNTIGKYVVPFDGDLASQDLGNGVWPIGSSYTYSLSTSYSLMLSDLQMPDEDPSDAKAKLEGIELPIEGRVVVIYGTQSDPDLPILCGVLRRVASYMEEPEVDWSNTDEEVEEPKPQPRNYLPPQPPPKPLEEDENPLDMVGREVRRWASSIGSRIGNWFRRGISRRLPHRTKPVP